MKYWRSLSKFFCALGFGIAPAAFSAPQTVEVVPAPTDQYTATIQLFIQEPTPQLVRRSQRLAVRQLTHTFRSRRDLELNNFDLKVSPAGNAIYLTVGSNKDIQQPVQNALASIITDLDGKVWAQGRGDVFRTNMAQPMEAILDIQLADMAPTPSGQQVDVGEIQIQRIIAVAVPVRDLLRTLKAHIIQDGRFSTSTFGHIMDRTCAERYVDWIFNESNDEPPRKLDTVIEELAAVLNVPGGVEKKDSRYVFKGACPSTQPTYPRRPTLSLPFPSQMGSPSDILDAGLQPIRHNGRPISVEIPLMPLGRW